MPILSPTRQEMYRRFWAEVIERSRSRTSVFEDSKPLRRYWLKGKSERREFSLNLILLQEMSRVECFIRFGRGCKKQNQCAFETLRQQRGPIEKSFGAILDWQMEIPHGDGCRISKEIEGGWKTRGLESPVLQDRMIGSMIKLEQALKRPILDLTFP